MKISLIVGTIEKSFKLCVAFNDNLYFQKKLKEKQQCQVSIQKMDHKKALKKAPNSLLCCRLSFPLVTFSSSAH